MNFGVWIPNCRHLAIPDVIRNTAVRAEALGYDSVWVSDHVLTPNANIGNFGAAVFDPFVTLAVAAGATRRVKLGTTVLIVPYRHAVVTAKMVSTLDALSGGRVILGVGAGWLPAESAMLNVPFAERGAMTDEHLRAMRELWTSEAPRFAGRYTQFDELRFEPKPVQNPLPIWVGGHSRAALRRTVEFGEAWHPINRPPDEIRTARAELQRMSREAGRAAPSIALRNDVCVLRAGAAARQSTHAGRVMAGEPAALVDQIRELAECGVDYLVLEFLSEDARALDEQMEVFAERVRPACGPRG